MSKSIKKQTFSKVSAVKSNARDRVGTPKASFVITPKNQRPSRYKNSWVDAELDEVEEIELYPDFDDVTGNVRVS
jgi:hypothetical protein